MTLLRKTSLIESTNCCQMARPAIGNSKDSQKSKRAFVLQISIRRVLHQTVQRTSSWGFERVETRSKNDLAPANSLRAKSGAKFENPLTPCAHSIFYVRIDILGSSENF